MKTTFQKYTLHFKQASGTSRGVLLDKETYIITIKKGNKVGVGECNLFKGLSADDVPEYEKKLQWTCDNITLGLDILWNELRYFPSIQFGLEQAFLNIKHPQNIYFPSDFTKNKAGIPINGLIWMGNVDFMKKQFQEKIQQGYTCIKLKIGTDWKIEHQFLQEIRQQYLPNELEIRVDANGAFSFEQAKIILKELAQLHIHSIEQPIKAKKYNQYERTMSN